MYGIFTYKTGWFCSGKFLSNIPAPWRSMEHLGSKCSCSFRAKKSGAQGRGLQPRLAGLAAQYGWHEELRPWDAGNAAGHAVAISMAICQPEMDRTGDFMATFWFTNQQYQLWWGSSDIILAYLRAKPDPGFKANQKLSDLNVVDSIHYTHLGKL